MTKGWRVVMAAVMCTLLSRTGLAAQADVLQLVPPEAVPADGTFYSVQQDAPPLPFDPFPELPVYLLPDGTYYIDDTSVEYGSLAAAQPEAESAAPAGQAQATIFSLAGVGEGCGLWLEAAASNNVGLLTLHNTRTGQTYTVWSIEDIGLTNWIIETNLTGGAGDVTTAAIELGTRTNLFLRASELRDYTNVLVFDGLSFTNTVRNPPDTMGAVGPDHFVEILNCYTTNASVAVYDKTGVLVATTATTNFFWVTRPGGSNIFQTGFGQTVIDPRVLFDHQSGRWVATAMAMGSTRTIVLAVSNDENPTNLTTGWTKYLYEFNSATNEIDFDTLGLDGNGIYFSERRGTTGIQWYTVVAIKKPEIYSGTNLSTYLETTNDFVTYAFQPAVNFDPVTTNDYVWFLAKGPPDTGTNYQGGPILYRRLQWQGTNAYWADTNWVEMANPGPSYQDYCELTVGTNFDGLPVPVGAPQAGTSTKINLTQGGSKLESAAVIRNGFMWVCHTMGLSGTNGTYTGDASGTNVDRSAVQWYKIKVNPDSSGLTLSEFGRVFDPAPTNGWWYYFPSLAVNCAGDMVMGFSGSSPTNYVSALYTWRLSNGSMPTLPRVYRAGTVPFTTGPGRWGDYSATTLDPADDWSFWTVQEHAQPQIRIPPQAQADWSTAIAQIRPNP